MTAQDKMLYVFDPKALHHIVVKVVLDSFISASRALALTHRQDQDIFQPSAQFTESAYSVMMQCLFHLSSDPPHRNQDDKDIIWRRTAVYRRCVCLETLPSIS